MIERASPEQGDESDAVDAEANCGTGGRRERDNDDRGRDSKEERDRVRAPAQRRKRGRTRRPRAGVLFAIGKRLCKRACAQPTDDLRARRRHTAPRT